MQTLYIITGAPGIGKSTISQALAEKLNKSAIIEGDMIYSQVVGSYAKPWENGNHLEVFCKICLDNIKNYLEYDYDVIFNYIVTPDILEQIKNKFSNYKVKFIVLTTDEETILKRDLLREKDAQMGERCVLLLNKFKSYGFDEKYFLDNSKLSIEDTVKTIENEERFLLKGIL